MIHVNVISKHMQINNYNEIMTLATCRIFHWRGQLSTQYSSNLFCS